MTALDHFFLGVRAVVTGDGFPAICVLGAVWVLGVWYGLYLNLTHWHRMRRWACSVSDALYEANKKGDAAAGAGVVVFDRKEQVEA